MLHEWTCFKFILDLLAISFRANDNEILNGLDEKWKSLSPFTFAVLSRKGFHLDLGTQAQNYHVHSWYSEILSMHETAQILQSLLRTFVQEDLIWLQVFQGEVLWHSCKLVGPIWQKKSHSKTQVRHLFSVFWCYSSNTLQFRLNSSQRICLAQHIAANLHL